MKKLLIISVAILGCAFNNNCAKAQDVLDGVYVQEHVPTKKVIQYTYLREADVLWNKRIWQVIDLREKINYNLYYPEDDLTDRRSLFSIMKNATMNEGLTIYKDDDQFRYPVTNMDEKLTFFVKVEMLAMTDAFGDPIYNPDGSQAMKPDSDWVDPYEIIEYHLKEDWFFDKQRSVMDQRIIGIAPVVWDKTENEEIRGKKELFWVYFPELRYYLQNEFVYNPQNDAQRMSFDDLFWKRMFNSYVYKETNVYDRLINQFQTGVNALLESDKVKDELFTVEHDVWHF